MQENQGRITEPAKSKRGFASMSPERQREIASQGGRTAHELRVAHEWSRQEAQEAGKKGGQVSGSRRRNSGTNREELL